ncbi:MAG: serine/threonine-protein kinase, partial [Nannocystaceae bacterium]
LRLISSGEHRQTPFIVYENVFSIGLDEHLAGAGQKDADFILKVAMTASRGLRAAAAAGINHRDIKPANLFLYAPDGRVKVTNFGLSSDPSIGPEGTSTLRGTPSYMAPELVVAAHSIDHRADMYSLGVTLYEAATGQLPFVKSTLLETMRAHVYDTPCALLDLRPSFPRGLAATIERLLSKRPDERFPDWAELVATFESIRCESENPISEAVTRAVKGVSGTASLASIYRKNNT